MGMKSFVFRLSRKMPRLFWSFSFCFPGTHYGNYSQVSREMPTEFGRTRNIKRIIRNVSKRSGRGRKSSLLRPGNWLNLTGKRRAKNKAPDFPLTENVLTEKCLDIADIWLKRDPSNSGEKPADSAAARRESATHFLSQGQHPKINRLIAGNPVAPTPYLLEHAHFTSKILRLWIRMPHRSILSPFHPAGITTWPTVLTDHFCRQLGENQSVTPRSSFEKIDGGNFLKWITKGTKRDKREIAKQQIWPPTRSLS